MRGRQPGMRARRVVVGALIAAAVVGVVAACGSSEPPAPRPGAVAVEISSNANTGENGVFTVQVRESDGDVLHEERMRAGESIRFDDIPPGEIAVSVTGLGEISGPIDGDLLRVIAHKDGITGLGEELNEHPVE